MYTHLIIIGTRNVFFSTVLLYYYVRICDLISKPRIILQNSIIKLRHFYSKSYSFNRSNIWAMLSPMYVPINTGYHFIHNHMRSSNVHMWSKHLIILQFLAIVLPFLYVAVGAFIFWCKLIYE